MSKVKRYVSLISYIGNRFKGSQRQLKRSEFCENEDSDGFSIQQALDNSLLNLVPKPLYTASKKIINENDKISSNNQSKPEVSENILKIIKSNTYNEDHYNFGYRTLMSSRTDSGVSSLMNCYIFDVVHPFNKSYKPELLTIMMNKYLVNKNLNLLVNRTYEINNYSDYFHVIEEKQYCYRLAFLKPQFINFNFMNSLGFTAIDLDDIYFSSNKSRSSTIYSKKNSDFLDNYYLYSFLPIDELYKVLPIKSKIFFQENNKLKEKVINIDLVKDALKMLVGSHNYTTFSKFTKNDTSVNKKNPTRNITRFELVERNVQDNLIFDRKYENFYWFDFYVKGDGFLYNQIRKMMGCVLSYGFGLINSDDIIFMLNNPNQINYNSKCIITPPEGLYLQDIFFNEKLFQVMDDKKKNDFDT